MARAGVAKMTQKIHLRGASTARYVRAMTRGILFAASLAALCPPAYSATVAGDSNAGLPSENNADTVARHRVAASGSGIVMLPVRISLQAGGSAKVFTMLGAEVRGPGEGITLSESGEAAADAGAQRMELPEPAASNPQGAASAFGAPVRIGAVPEPSAAVLATLGVLAMLRRRRA